jgi:hypothetical protein
MMPCTGHCLDVAPIALSSPPERSNEEGDPAASVSEPTETYTYTHLKPWQTRVLRLHPSDSLSDGREARLSADLLVVTVSDAEDFLIESSGATIEYTALSYSWGRPVLGKTLICNGMRLPISGSNAAALVALRDPTEPKYLWIDAICINQEDALEKSAQVARMIKIYQKAQSVAVWLGEPDADSLLAFACIHGMSELQQELSKFGQTTHVPLCRNRMKSIFRALLSLYNRPWLRRTWVRQEIFGARRLVIHCGSQQTSWDGFVGAADLMEMVRALVKDEVLDSEDQHMQYSRLLTEAVSNARLPPTGVKSPRQLTQVLLGARNFEATDPKDTFYAVLGMCNVVAFSKETAQRRQESKGAVLVDYEKSLVEVYQDATSCTLNRRGGPRNLADLWHPYKRGSLHGEGLPLWAVDWQSGTHEKNRRATLKEARELRAPLSYSIVEANEQHAAPDEAADVTGAWYWPQPLSSDPKILCLRARVLNYVAYLTDFTCEIDQLAEESFGRLGLTAWAIHGRRMLRDPMDGHVIMYPNPKWEKFNPETHSRRLAILGVGNRGQLCLVPSTTKKGDLIVGISPDLLAMAISPMRSDRTIGGLIPQDDAYENITDQPLERSRSTRIPMFLCDYSMLILLPFTVAFTTLLLHLDFPSSGATILMSSYCMLLLLLLLGHVASLYLHALNFDSPWSPRGWFRHWVEITSLLGQIILSPVFLLVFGTLTIPVAQSDLRMKIATAWVGASVAALLVGYSLRISRQIRVHMAMASRRIDVFKTLDSVTEILGRDFEFHGAVLVRGCDFSSLSGRRWAQYSLRIRFVIDSLLNSRTQDRSSLGAKFTGMRWIQFLTVIDSIPFVY